MPDARAIEENSDYFFCIVRNSLSGSRYLPGILMHAYHAPNLMIIQKCLI